MIDRSSESPAAPQTHELAPAPANANEAQPRAGHARLRHSPELILVVDDDPNIRDSLAEVLRLENYQVRLACDGREAVRRFLEGPPDLILLDLNMPDINGWQAFQIMAELYPFVPVIVITARPGQTERAAQIGVDVVLEKPLDMPELLETIRRLLTQPDITRFDRVVRAWGAKDHRNDSMPRSDDP